MPSTWQTRYHILVPSLCCIAVQISGLWPGLPPIHRTTLLIRRIQKKLEILHSYHE